VAKVRPPAELAPRPGDEELTVDELQKISLFAGLKEQPGMEEFPGTLILRRYRKGDVVCRIGEPGWTAFYILTSKDLESLRGGRFQTQAQSVADAPAGDGSSLRRVAFVQSGLPRPPRRWDRFRQLFQQPARSEAHPLPREAFLTEGELFGEMSCLYRTPRSATVVVEQDCYMLELLRNILDKMLSNRNRAFKDQIDALYRKRVLDLQVRSLPLFRDLPAVHLDRLCSKAELEALEPGEIICDEHERSESMYIVRTGFVKTVKNASRLLGREDTSDWQAFGTGLHAGSSETGPRRKVWELLPESTRLVLTRAADGGKLSADEEQEVTNALNDLLKQPKLHAAAEFKETLQGSGLADEIKKLPASLKKWVNHQQICDFNHRLLSAIYPGIFPAPRAPDQVRVLSYRSQGDFIGEMGLLTGQPRSATCIAYDHPDSKFGRVELVRISKQLFDEILSASPELRTIVTTVVEENERRTGRIMNEPLWDDRNAATLSERFAELGLIQGQKLMLIDLDRCTRCDECVKACVATHPQDGRSRLFLDGPVFKTALNQEHRNFLVPATCRQCKDPVCLIGCPVGSIHKGENGQIVIEDWCIGCRRCAEQCPYSAIQMHAEGILPRQSRGWRYRGAPAATAGSAWYDRRFDDRSWLEGQTPFRYDRELRDHLGRPQEIHFRRFVEVTAGSLAQASSFHLQVLSLSGDVTVWINGCEVIRKTADRSAAVRRDKQEQWNLEAELGPAQTAGSSGAARGVLQLGRNLVAASVAQPENSTDVLFELGIYQVSRPVVPTEMSGELTQELVMNKAVVCDMCSAQFGQRPACVNACPHDAAMRVDARVMFRERAVNG
jgi:Fe-S-cluster-containing dehydrogenase component